jgi:hypothetical protein
MSVNNKKSMKLALAKIGEALDEYRGVVTKENQEQADFERAWKTEIEIECLTERVKLLTEMLDKANSLLRSAFEIAKREGKDTYWPGFKNGLDEILKEQHRVMYPKQYVSKVEFPSHVFGPTMLEHKENEHDNS